MGSMEISQIAWASVPSALHLLQLLFQRPRDAKALTRSRDLSQRPVVLNSSGVQHFSASDPAANGAAYGDSNKIYEFIFVCKKIARPLSCVGSEMLCIAELQYLPSISIFKYLLRSSKNKELRNYGV